MQIPQFLDVIEKNLTADLGSTYLEHWEIIVFLRRTILLLISVIKLFSFIYLSQTQKMSIYTYTQKKRNIKYYYILIFIKNIQKYQIYIYYKYCF